MPVALLKSLFLHRDHNHNSKTPEFALLNDVLGKLPCLPACRDDENILVTEEDMIRHVTKDLLSI